MENLELKKFAYPLTTLVSDVEMNENELMLIRSLVANITRSVYEMLICATEFSKEFSLEQLVSIFSRLKVREFDKQEMTDTVDYSIIQMLQDNNTVNRWFWRPRDIFSEELRNAVDENIREFRSSYDNPDFKRVFEALQQISGLGSNSGYDLPSFINNNLKDLVDVQNRDWRRAFECMVNYLKEIGRLDPETINIFQFYHEGCPNSVFERIIDFSVSSGLLYWIESEYLDSKTQFEFVFPDILICVYVDLIEEVETKAESVYNEKDSDPERVVDYKAFLQLLESVCSLERTFRTIDGYFQKVSL